MRSSRRRLVLVPVAIGLLAAIAVWPDKSWHRADVVLDEEFTLQISFKHTHPVLAEYARTLDIFRRGQRTGELRYHQDTGGGLPLRLRYHADAQRHWVRLTDSLYDQVVNLDRGVILDNADQGDGLFKVAEVSEAKLPPLRREWVLDRNFKLQSGTARD